MFRNVRFPTLIAKDHFDYITYCRSIILKGWYDSLEGNSATQGVILLLKWAGKWARCDSECLTQKVLIPSLDQQN